MVVGPLGCSLEGLSCSYKKILVSWRILGCLWEIMGKFDQKRQKYISLKPLLVRIWLTIHFNPNTHFSNSVWYNVCFPGPQKWLKMQFFFFSFLFFFIEVWKYCNSATTGHIKFNDKYCYQNLIFFLLVLHVR